MKEFIIRIPDNQSEFFLELVKGLGFTEVTENEVTSEQDKELIFKRITSSKKGDLLDWEEVKDRFVFSR
jgi:hypothetical protein